VPLGGWGVAVGPIRRGERVRVAGSDVGVAGRVGGISVQVGVGVAGIGVAVEVTVGGSGVTVGVTVGGSGVGVGVAVGESGVGVEVIVGGSGVGVEVVVGDSGVSVGSTVGVAGMGDGVEVKVKGLTVCSTGVGNTRPASSPGSSIPPELCISFVEVKTGVTFRSVAVKSGVTLRETVPTAIISVRGGVESGCFKIPILIARMIEIPTRPAVMSAPAMPRMAQIMALSQAGRVCRDERRAEGLLIRLIIMLTFQYICSPSHLTQGSVLCAALTNRSSAVQNLHPRYSARAR